MAGLIPFPLWGQRGWCTVEVVGESFHAESLRALFAEARLGHRDEVEGTAHLLPVPGDPTDPDDPGAVRVFCEGLHVGDLPAPIAPRYALALRALVDAGLLPTVAFRAWGGEYEPWGEERRAGGEPGARFSGGVHLDLAEPHLVAPRNHPPAGDAPVLPPGHPIQVWGDGSLPPRLRTYLRPEGEAWVYATLHPLHEQPARSVVEVRVDGAPVGRLTPRTSSELLPVVERVAAAGGTCAARALLSGTAVRAEVVLSAQRAPELPPGWPAGDRPTEGSERRGPWEHPTVPSRPSRMAFNPAPGWPEPPAGWEPFPGWKPLPEWPPAPEGWEFWVGR